MLLAFSRGEWFRCECFAHAWKMASVPPEGVCVNRFVL
jgi:hypothetical protein